MAKLFSFPNDTTEPLEQLEIEKQSELRISTVGLLEYNLAVYDLHIFVFQKGHLIQYL